MDYANLLSSYISNSKMSLTQVTEALKVKGFSSHKGYISKLQNGKLPPAGDDLNRALAEVTGGDPKKLIWAAHLEKIPKDMKEFFMSFDGTLLNAAIDLEKKFPGFLNGQCEMRPEILNSEEFQRLKEHLEFWGFSSTEFMNPSGITTKSLEVKNEDTTLYKSFYNKSITSLSSIHSSPESQVELKGIIVMSFTALELRLNEVLIKAIQLNGTTPEVAMNYLKEATLSTKLRSLLSQNLGHDISQEPYSLELWGYIDLYHKITFNELHEQLTQDKVRHFLKTINLTIDTLNDLAKQKGIM